MKDPRWAALERAEPLLGSAFAEEGVTAVRFVAAFPALDSVGVWLCTTTDAERERLVNAPDVSARAARCLRDAGLNALDEADLATTVQSEETVARDYQGSWFYAMR